MQSLHKKNKATFSKGWIPSVKIEENKRKRAVIPTCLHLYHYAGNNPITYIDPNGACAYSLLLELDEEYNKEQALILADILRTCVGADYSHVRMPTDNKMDCSGTLVYGLDKMGFEVPSDLTADKILNEGYSWIIILDKVDNSKQGEPGMLNLYYFGESYISHINYGVGKLEDETENQIVDASSLGTTWQETRNLSKKQNQKAEAGKVNITWAPFSSNSVPDFQAKIDFTKLQLKEVVEE